MSESFDASMSSASISKKASNGHSGINNTNANAPDYDSLKRHFNESSLLVEDIILKNYLTRLTEFEVVPLDDSLKSLSNIRLFKINEMVYQNDEYSTYKFASVFNSVQSLNCGVFIIANSDGNKTDFYMGVRSLDEQRTTKSLKDTLRNALMGQFPGVKTTDLLDTAAQSVLDNIQSKNIAAVSTVAQNKDVEFNDNDRFIQGMEKLALSMQGHRYTAVILAKSMPSDQLSDVRRAYETVYTSLSPFANLQLSYGTNMAINISEAFSNGTNMGTSQSTNHSLQEGYTQSVSKEESYSETKTDTKAMLAKGIGSALLGVASLAAAPLTGGASLVAAGSIMAGQIGLSAINPKQISKGESKTASVSHNWSETNGESDSTNESYSENNSKSHGLTRGSSDTVQLTMQNKTLINTLERIDLQLERIDECESLGMWECAAYFLSDSQETAEMAAGTYKALMSGENSGVQTSAINFWGGNLKRFPIQKRKTLERQLPLLREYITSFIHPVFEYRSDSASVPVTAASLVSGNELSIQMGLPRKSVCGFPVIRHADFGREVVKYNPKERSNSFVLGKVFGMGKVNDTEVRSDLDSLAMHTFITGSTGSGKSNTVYEILNQLRNHYNIPFLVIESAKGEYKNIFGQFSDVMVYGTNPQKTSLLRINPFSFPADVHVLEHLDRLVEIFNVCWPMYAAMPAILKEAIENAYISTGWNIASSENVKGEVFPNFSDLLEQIERVIDASKYSVDSKGDYVGALCTRIRSLTNGLNGQIFTSAGISDVELFDKNVIVDLSRVGSIETKALIMGLLVMKLNEYRMASGKSNSPLAHITVLEEAHNLLKRTTMEQSSDTSNLLGKSVELLSNSISEMRTYGEGFIIADQSPGLLDLSVIRSTNTKIILRLPEQSDRELVGRAASLNEEQIRELSKLEQGVAAIYQNDWVEPVLVKINKCSIIEKPFDGTRVYSPVDVPRAWKHLIYLLIQGRVPERFELDTDLLDRNMDSLGLTTSNREFVEDQLTEFKTDGKLALWKDNNFLRLSRRISTILGIRGQVETLVKTVRDNDEMTEKLSDIVRSFVPDATVPLTIALSQCFMRDFSSGSDEQEIREKIYKQWIEEMIERGKES